MDKISWRRFSIDLLFVAGALTAVAVLVAPRGATPQAQPAACNVTPTNVSVCEPASASPPPPAVVPPRPRRDQLVEPKFAPSAEERERQVNNQLLQLTEPRPDYNPAGGARPMPQSQAPLPGRMPAKRH